MKQVTKQYRTETAHRLLDYDGRCAYIHGHSYLWEVTVESNQLDKQGMVVDFKELKQAMDHTLDPLDHALVLHHQDPLLAQLSGQGRVIRWPKNPTAENYAEGCAQTVQSWFDARDIPVVVVACRCWETATSYATWRKSTQ